MKRTVFVLCAFFLILTVIACDFAGVTIDLGGEDEGKSPTSQPQNLSVEVGIDAPANGAVLQMGPVDIAYHASSTEGVSMVELSIDGSVVSSITSPDANQKVVALRYTWNPPASGSHTLQARAQNKAGAWSNLATAAVTIQGAQPPAQQGSQSTNTPEPTKTPEPTATADKVTIFDVEHDKDKFFYGGGGCGSREITISAKVTKPEDVYSLVLFIRFFDNEGAGTSKWDAGHAMSKKSDGNYSITLASNKITNYNLYEFTAMNYQMVATDKSRNNLARTEVFKDIALDICP